MPIAVNLASTTPRAALLPGRVYEIVRRRRRAPPADQRAELYPLQDLRHQGPDAEHMDVGCVRRPAASRRMNHAYSMPGAHVPGARQKNS